MAADNQVEIRGLRELIGTLRRLPTAILDKVMLASTRAAADSLAREVRKRAPLGRGYLSTITRGRRKGTVRRIHLRNAIMVQQVRVPGGDEVKFQVGVHQVPRKYAHLVEFGTAAHVIKPRLMTRVRNRLLGMLSVNGRLLPRVKHPGSRARPFFQPAFESGSGAALDAMVAVCREKMDSLRSVVQ